VTEARVLLVDDHTAVRQAVRSVLAAESDVRVVGDTGDLAEAIRLARTAAPNVVVLDLKLPGTSGIEVVRRFRAAAPGPAIVVFSMHGGPQYVYSAMHAGAAAYVLKSAEWSELLQAIRTAARGGRFLQGEVTRPLLERLAFEARSHGGAEPPTPREIEVLECVADGMTNKEIATRFGIAEETVKTHLKHLYEKLGVADRAQAVAVALRQQVID
jgi:DNA-binding NarL/FixJ family response regulator